MANHDVNLATKNNKFKSKSLDECFNSLYTMHTYLKDQYNKNKRQHTEPTKLVPISFVELKIKQEKDYCIFSKHSLTQAPAQHWSANKPLDTRKRPLRKYSVFYSYRKFLNTQQMLGKNQIPIIQPHGRNN